MITKTKDNNLVISIRNNHVPDCGPPPAIEANPSESLYRGYFENQHGEQWVVEIDRETKTGILRGGDIGWDREIPLRDNRIDGDVILNNEEYTWLWACWLAVTGEKLKNPAWDKMRATMAEFVSDD